MFVSMQVQGQPPEGPVRDHLERRLRGAVRPYGSRALGIALRAETTRIGGRVSCRVAISLDSGVYAGAAKGANVFFAAEEALAKATRHADRAARREVRTAPGLVFLPTGSGG